MRLYICGEFDVPSLDRNELIVTTALHQKVALNPSARIHVTQKVSPTILPHVPSLLLGLSAPLSLF